VGTEHAEKASDERAEDVARDRDPHGDRLGDEPSHVRAVPELRIVTRLRSALSRLTYRGDRQNARPATPPANRARKLPDCGFLVIVVGLSAVFYVHRLGFSSDDWAFLSSFSNSHDQSLLGLIRAAGNFHLYPRPVQVLEMASLYSLFGSNPVGYHVVQTAVLAALAVLFYLVLRELHQPRLLALAVPAVYLTLPSYSAARFWYTGYLAALSGVLYFLTLYTDLRSIRARPSRWWIWRIASLITLLGSTLAYEVFLPLFVINPLLAWWQSRQLHGDTRDHRKRLAVLAAGTLIPLIIVTAYKARVSERLVIPGGVFDYFYWIARRAISRSFEASSYGFNVWQAIDLHFGDYGVRLPRIVWRAIRSHPDGSAVASAALVGLIVFAYLARVAGQTGDHWPHDPRVWLQPLLAGLGIFGLGYAIFLTNWNIQFTPTGIGSRTAIAAAVGVSLTFVGAAGWILGRVPSAAARRLFCGFIATVCASGVLALNTIATYYVAASREERAVLTSIRRDIPAMPPGSTLILDGVCPYIGPGIVFESNWDLEGALRTIYRDPTLHADVVTPRMAVGDDCLSTRIYGSIKRYPYERLMIYHPGRRSALWIANAGEARHYFSMFNPDLTSGCPPGFEGHGVSIF
jgi:hypothetical protein